MSSISEVSVHYRHVELQSSAQLHAASDGGLFLDLAEPPPVRTVLELRKLPEGAKGRAYEITAVVEVEAGGATRGCRVREVDNAALKSRAVGSERLADASAGTAPASPTPAAAHARPDDAGDEPWADEYGVQMAVPAPVVDPDGSDDSGESEVNADAGEDNGDDDGSASASDSDASRTAAGGKKRRGRRRK